MADIEELIDAYYNDPATGLIGQAAFWKKNRDTLLQHGITKKEVTRYFDNKGGVEQRKPQGGRPHVLAPIYFYQADLMFYEGTILLCCISMRSRRAYVYIVPDKTGASITDAMQQLIMDTMRVGIPATIMTDEGSEFNNDTFHLLCERFAIGHAKVPPKEHDRLGAVERFNKSLRHRIDLYREGHKKSKWQDQLSEIVYGYNTTVHSVTGSAPEFTSEELELPHKQVMHNLAIEEAIRKNYKPGTKVRMYLKPGLFKKGSAMYSNEVYVVVKQNKYTVVVKSEDGGEEVKITIDKLKRIELLSKAEESVSAPGPVAGDDLYAADRILAHRIAGNRVEYKVKWDGHPISKATWEPVENVRATSDPHTISPIEKEYLRSLPTELWQELKALI